MALQSRPFLVGAAVGNGMTAQAAQRGGADFLLALNAGRFRAMGLPSIASILPLKDSNRLVMAFASEEILGRVELPVFYGIAAQDRKADFSALVAEAAEAGFAGIANFPTVAWIDGRVRAALEAAGFGLSRELGLLKMARERGLRTIAYVRTIDEARAFADIGADIVNLNFGWNAGGRDTRPPRQELEEVAGYARHVFKAIRAARPGTICSIEGGPIIEPDHLIEVCRLAEADAYIGGSTIDRLPTEVSIAETTARFKAVWPLENPARRFVALGASPELSGASPPMRALHAALAGLPADRDPVLIVGEAGSGKRTAALVLHHAAHGAAPPVEIDLGGRSPEQQMSLLFGDAGAGPGRRLGWLEWAGVGTIIVRGLLSASADCQKRLAELVTEAAAPRLIVLHTPRKGADPREQIRRFPAMLRRHTVHIPPLRARAGDIPALAELLLAGIGGRGLTAEAKRLLLQHDWPGNVGELRDVLAAAVQQAGAGLIGDGVLRPLLRPGLGHAVSKRLFDSEREWILHGLSVNGFRRIQTAAYLGMSRKTLYNKIRQYDIR